MSDDETEATATAAAFDAEVIAVDMAEAEAANDRARLAEARQAAQVKVEHQREHLAGAEAELASAEAALAELEE